MTQPVPPARGAVPRSFYDEVGGRPVFETIVDRFYEIAIADPTLRPLFATSDAATVRRRITAFFVQYWGGPRDYSRERGHPRLALRHSHFRIERAEYDAWLAAMRAALEGPKLTAEQRAVFYDYLVAAAARLTGQAP